MNNEKIISVLSELAQLDIDAVSAYEQALKHIKETEIYNNLEKFKNDHTRHINDLNMLIRKYNGVPPEKTLDFKGYLIEGFTSLRSITGIRGALSAMQANEITTNKKYKQAIEENPGMPQDVAYLLQKNYGDEKYHLRYIKEALEMVEV